MRFLSINPPLTLLLPVAIHQRSGGTITGSLTFGVGKGGGRSRDPERGVPGLKKAVAVFLVPSARDRPDGYHESRRDTLHKKA